MSESNQNELQTLSPIYIQLRELIRNSIEDGEYLPGTAIPSENTLAKKYGINRITVRNSVDALVKEGLLIRKQGKGVFVVGNKIENFLDNEAGFLHDSEATDIYSPKVIVKSNYLRKANEKYSDLFDIQIDDPIFFIERYLLVEGARYALEQIYIPKKILPNLNAIDSSVFSFEEIFSFYNLDFAGKRQSLEIVNGDSNLRRLLNIPEDIVIVLMKCWYQGLNGENIMYIEQWIRSDYSSFTINL